MDDYFRGQVVSDEELRERWTPFPQPWKTQGLAFHEWSQEGRLSDWSETVAWFFGTFGAPLHKVSWCDALVPGVMRKPNNTRWRSGRLINFPKLRDALDNGMMARAQVSSCMALRPDATLPWTDWTTFAHIVQDYAEMEERTLFYGVVPEVGRLDAEQQKELARRVAEVFGPCYGTVYYWPHFYGPYQYSYGGGQLDLRYICEKDFAESRSQNNGQANRRFNTQFRAFPVRDGYMRDIYPMSFLPAAHLRAPVEGTTFEAWQQRAGLGALTELAPGYAAWEVAREEADEAREVLRRNNRLLAYIDKPR